MKKFKDFKPKVTKPYVPDEPIHFKYVKPEKDEPYVPDEPVHFKYVNLPKGQIKEEVLSERIQILLPHINKWKEKNDNGHLLTSNDEKKSSKKNDVISDKLHKNTEKHLNSFDDNTKKHIHDHIQQYVKDSRNLNKALINHHKYPEDGNEAVNYHKNSIQNLDHISKKPIDHELHVYSGVGFDPKKIRQKGGIIHLPAYTSTSHDKNIVRKFTKTHVTHDDEKSNEQHILHIHLKPNDKAAHISRVGFRKHEHETILPRNTQLKVHHTPTVYKTDEIYNGKPTHVHVWHATIHHQD